MSDYADRIDRLAAEARRRREAFDPPESPADERAMELLRSGLAPVLSVYIEARSEGGVRFDQSELDALHRATNDWLVLYARCYGVDLDADFTVREAAELVVDTHNIRDVAQLLTGVPPR